ncbi:MAG TPA: hypothetical protein VND40_05605 [Nitrososphaerales archaeon]|nr:hypothetical protein [Nitrososphaerales archaeon]
MSGEPSTPSVTVKLKRGSWEIEITCAPDKVQQAVESVLAGMVSKELVSIEASLDSPAAGEDGKRFDTCRGLLERMWKEGWFASEKTLGEVHEELARRGYHYDRTAVSHSLVDLVREGTLFRDGTMRNYRYVQKRPPEPQAAGA